MAKSDATEYPRVTIRALCECDATEKARASGFKTEHVHYRCEKPCANKLDAKRELMNYAIW